MTLLRSFDNSEALFPLVGRVSSIELAPCGIGHALISDGNRGEEVALVHVSECFQRQ